jgi:hypothetical protein
MVPYRNPRIRIDLDSRGIKDFVAIGGPHIDSSREKAVGTDRNPRSVMGYQMGLVDFCAAAYGDGIGMAIEFDVGRNNRLGVDAEYVVVPPQEDSRFPDPASGVKKNLIVSIAPDLCMQSVGKIMELCPAVDFN